MILLVTTLYIKILKHCFLVRTTNAQMLTIFTSANNASSLDADEIKVHPLQCVLDLIVSYIADTFNLCLSTGALPKRMQISKVTVQY